MFLADPTCREKEDVREHIETAKMFYREVKIQSKIDIINGNINTYRYRLNFLEKSSSKFVKKNGYGPPQKVNDEIRKLRKEIKNHEARLEEVTK